VAAAVVMDVCRRCLRDDDGDFLRNVARSAAVGTDNVAWHDRTSVAWAGPHTSAAAHLRRGDRSVGADGLGEPVVVLGPPADSDGNVRSIGINSFAQSAVLGPDTEGNLSVRPLAYAETHVTRKLRRSEQVIGATRRNAVRSLDDSVTHRHADLIGGVVPDVSDVGMAGIGVPSTSLPIHPRPAHPTSHSRM
jgi:hypothetical protein